MWILVKTMGCFSARRASGISISKLSQVKSIFFRMETTSIPVHPIRAMRQSSMGVEALACPPDSKEVSITRACPLPPVPKKRILSTHFTFAFTLILLG